MPPIDRDKPTHYTIHDRHDGGKQIGGTHKSGATASARVSKLDNEYGGYRYMRRAHYADDTPVGTAGAGPGVGPNVDKPEN